VSSAAAADTGEDADSAADSGAAPEVSGPTSATGTQAGAETPPGADTTPPDFHLLTPEQAADGWISLFDGQTLFGWTSNNPEVDWHVADGALVATTGPIGLLNTTIPFADYELSCDFRFEPGGNSGLFLRTVTTPTDVRKDCYELNIADVHPEGFTTGGIVGHAKTEEAIIASGAWHTFHATLNGSHVTVQLDGTMVLDYTDPTSARRSGWIGLQHNAGKVEFRNVRLRPLGLSDLFNGKDTTGWRVVPGSKSTFAVEDGTIHATNGPGFLETEDTYGDFVFQAAALVHGTELNSGFFFRAQQGTEAAPSNGYELQIHNGFRDGDRNRPSNAGTGAIFRRVEARRVVSDDGKWCHVTLVASGPRMAVWVDGYQVVDWEDQRTPHDNPRQGQRLAAGHISLQGHDPTTDLSFRNLRIGRLP
jgi:hypothetical protein